MSEELQRHFRKGERHLSKSVPQFRTLIQAVGPCTLSPEPDIFQVLVRSIVSQLISTAAARTITGRILERAKNRLTPTALSKLTEDELRACGLSRAKAQAVLDLAKHFRTNRSFATDLTVAEDDHARSMLLPLRGIGPWTVDMVLMFSLARPDILPVGDMGLRAGARDVFGLANLPTPVELTALAEPWRPYRSLATWYLWRSRGLVPQSGAEE